MGNLDTGTSLAPTHSRSSERDQNETSLPLLRSSVNGVSNRGAEKTTSSPRGSLAKVERAAFSDKGMNEEILQSAGCLVCLKEELLSSEGNIIGVPFTS